MYGVVWVSLIWMYWTEVRRTEVIGPHASLSQAHALSAAHRRDS
jgi:MFS transporter, NNP family, nitrate/nitrite transporter